MLSIVIRGPSRIRYSQIIRNSNIIPRFARDPIIFNVYLLFKGSLLQFEEGEGEEEEEEDGNEN